MNKGISSWERSFSSNKREPGADALHFRLSTSAVPYYARATNCGNNKRPSRGMAKMRRVDAYERFSFRFPQMKIYFIRPADFPLSRNKIHPTMLVVNSENISAEYIGEFVDHKTKYNLLFTFHFFFAEHFPQPTNSRSRREEEKKRALLRKLV